MEGEGELLSGGEDGDVSRWAWGVPGEALGMAGVVREDLIQRLRRAGVGSVGGTTCWPGHRCGEHITLATTTERTASMTWAGCAVPAAAWDGEGERRMLTLRLWWKWLWPDTLDGAGGMSGLRVL